MANIHVGVKNLEKAYRMHWTSSEKDDVQTNSAMLLKVYSVECGLKALLLRQRGQQSTVHLAEDDLLIHDLNALLAVLNQRRMALRIPVAKEPRKVQVDATSLHEIYRYGGQFEVKDNEKIAAGLHEIEQFLQENL